MNDQIHKLKNIVIKQFKGTHREKEQFFNMLLTMLFEDSEEVAALKSALDKKNNELFAFKNQVDTLSSRLKVSEDEYQALKLRFENLKKEYSCNYPLYSTAAQTDPNYQTYYIPKQKRFWNSGIISVDFATSTQTALDELRESQLNIQQVIADNQRALNELGDIPF